VVREIAGGGGNARDQDGRRPVRRAAHLAYAGGTPGLVWILLCIAGQSHPPGPLVWVVLHAYLFPVPIAPGCPAS
jgi:hypothetical protein